MLVQFQGGNYMKYYVYISQSKIDMLYNQIISQNKDISFKSGINLGIISIEAESNSKI